MTCHLASWSGASDRCHWCDEPFGPDGPLDGSNELDREDPGGWCSMSCQDAYRREHWWDFARLMAKNRDDDRCVQCGNGPATPLMAKCFLLAITSAQPADFKSREWKKFVQDCAVEVHHLVPRRGRGYGAGCHHHVDLLAVLCHKHHAEVTALQVAAEAA